MNKIGEIAGYCGKELIWLKVSDLENIIRSVMQFIAYQLDKNSDKPLYWQLQQQIKQAIYQQHLKLGDKLPAKRYLCQHLQISQSTVETAYAQLVAEGYLESVARVGFFVSVGAESPLLSSHLPKATSLSHLNEVSSAITKKQQAKKQQTATACILDFNPHRIDSRHFPFERWKKVSKQVLNLPQADILHLGEQQGDEALRIQLAHYLYSARGVQCQPEQIVIAAGVEHLMSLLMLTLEHYVLKLNAFEPNTLSDYSTQHLQYGMEAFGYGLIEKLLANYHKPLIKLPLDPHSKRLDLAQFLQSDVDIAYLTPSHQYPFGSVLTISERQQLLAWAANAPQRFLIEDDYDSEFRYQGKPIPSLKSLDHRNKVIYFGSLSKLLMPSIRVSFMVLPNSLLPAYSAISQGFKCSVSRLEQQIVARFMAQGYFEQHINRMRKRYRTKMELLCHLLKPYQPQIRYYGEHSGFYLLIELYQETRSQAELVALAAQSQLKIYPINWQNCLYFVIGFGDLNEAELQQGIAQLLSCWFG